MCGCLSPISTLVESHLRNPGRLRTNPIGLVYVVGYGWMRFWPSLYLTQKPDSRGRPCLTTEGSSFAHPSFLPRDSLTLSEVTTSPVTSKPSPTGDFPEVLHVCQENQRQGWVPKEGEGAGSRATNHSLGVDICLGRWIHDTVIEVSPCPHPLVCSGSNQRHAGHRASPPAPHRLSCD